MLLTLKFCCLMAGGLVEVGLGLLLRLPHRPKSSLESVFDRSSPNTRKGLVPEERLSPSADVRLSPEARGLVVFPLRSSSTIMVVSELRHFRGPRRISVVGEVSPTAPLTAGDPSEPSVPRTPESRSDELRPLSMANRFRRFLSPSIPPSTLSVSEIRCSEERRGGRVETEAKEDERLRFVGELRPPSDVSRFSENLPPRFRPASEERRPVSEERRPSMPSAWTRLERLLPQCDDGPPNMCVRSRAFMTFAIMLFLLMAGPESE